MVRTNSIRKNVVVDAMDTDKLRQIIMDRLKDIERPEDLRYLVFVVEQIILRDLEPGNVTPAQWRLLQEALESVKRGEGISEEESNREIDKWLREN